jgi:hypothetical protein
VIHDNLVRHFDSRPKPELSAQFPAQLRQRLEGAAKPSRHPALVLWWRWAPRVYWIVAIALAMKTVRPPAFELAHMVAMAVGGLLSVLVLQRALRPTALSRILRDALR